MVLQVLHIILTKNEYLQVFIIYKILSKKICPCNSYKSKHYTKETRV